MIRDFEFQTIAVRELIEHTNSLLELQGNKTIVFKAPTGSGKTVMMAKFLKELVEGRGDARRFSFIWTAPRQLHTQSKAKLEKHYADSKALRCVSFEDLIDLQIGDNEILFLNWESINKADNIYIRENERDFNLSTIVQNTRDAGRIIILVIDESHHAAKSEISRGLIAMFDPKVSLEVSATPTLTDINAMVVVEREKVIDEGMIKKRIAINPGFKNVVARQEDNTIHFASEAAESTDEFVLRMALEKRAALAQGFEAAGANVNPLLLIQLPDKRQGENDIKVEVARVLKVEHIITVENGKLAIYLSEDKANLENITRNDNEAEVMIFKQAIALGWDCPRASILVLFRDWQSFTFSTQTLGRILRMPELKHYENDDLNAGYVFTNLGDLSILEDTAGTYLTIQYAQRVEGYLELKLRSVHAKRVRGETRLTPQFIRDFLTAADELELKNKVNCDIEENISLQLLADGVVNNVDLHPEHIADRTEHIQRKQNVMEIQKLFDAFARERLKPEFFPEMRSLGRVKDAIHYFFKTKFPMEFTSATTRAQFITLHPENQQHFIDALNRAKEIYQEQTDRKHSQIITSEWDVPFSRNFNNRYFSRALNKSVTQPYYEADNASGPEKDFAAFLNNTLKDVEWFYRNGDQDATSFAVAYIGLEGNPALFYVDWVVKFEDGRIGLFDTKSDITAETAKTRAEGLAAYIKAENKIGKKLWGGIVVPKAGSWYYNDSEKYTYEPSLKGWKILG
ncbi:MAG: DEAD/DEAH box helicase family protein [Chloroflexota bacterium]